MTRQRLAEFCGSVTHHYVLWEKIVTERAVIKDDLVERGFGELHHLTLVVTAVFVLAEDFLSLHQLPQRRLVTLRGKKCQCGNKHEI